MSPQIKTLTLHYNNHSFAIEYFIRPGTTGTILFIHGLGGCKENFWQALQHDELKCYTIISFDNPGTGNSTYYDDQPINIDDLVNITTLFIEELALDNFVLTGASMGGLTTLHYLKNKGTARVKAFINIEGNLTLQDCMFSSKVISHSYLHFEETVYPETIQQMKRHGNVGYHQVANNLELNTTIQSYYHYSFQTVMYSKTGDLLQQFIDLRLPKLFIYGDRNQHLEYLPLLKNQQINLCCIENSDHFVFYDNPQALYQCIARFLDETFH